MRWHVLCQTIDGRFHYLAAFRDREAALEYLDQLEEECLPTHRCVIRNSEDVVITSYGGDDDVITFVISDDELHLYEEVLR